MSEPSEPEPSLDVVVCTYNNAAGLDHVLEALASQRVPGGVDWGVLVVDNNCTDGTAAVLERRARDPLALRVVREREQGLTAARRRGVQETSRAWIAFVDDDCVLGEDWIARAVAIARRRPEAGAFGGVVALEWEGDPPEYVQRYGWAYAQQEHGSEPTRVDCLAGAGMVVRRAALVETGWPDRQLLADRVGDELISGGDVEIVLRIGARRELWFEPGPRLRHVVPARRTAPRHLARLAYGLGASKLFGDSMLWGGGYPRWVARSLLEALPFARAALSAARRGRRVDAAVSLSFLGGWLAGIWRLLRADPEWRDALLGAATLKRS